MHQLVLGEDFPVLDPLFPPGIQGLSFGAERCLLHGGFYYPQGKGPHPTIVLCHGFPGFEKNLDLAQTFRSAGFNVFIFSYRGAWGSEGDFCFSHAIADTKKAVCFLSRPDFPRKDLVDEGRIILMGHSMGGFMALNAAAALPEVKHVVSIAGWNIGRDVRMSRENAQVRARLDDILHGVTVLQGPTLATLWNELFHHEDDFDLCSLAPRLKGRHVLAVAATNDAETPAALSHAPLAQALHDNGVHLTERWIGSDHSFSSARLTLARTILDWLAEEGF